MSSLRVSPLNALHHQLGAKMVEFGGWEMPISYPSGTIAEHLTCRSDAVVFDVSHLGTVRIEGSDAKKVLQSVLTNDLDKISVGRTQYTHLLTDSGGVLDDLIIWWIRVNQFDVMPNASNTKRFLDSVGGVDITKTRALLSIQGPRAREAIVKVSGQFAQVKRNTVDEIEWHGAKCVVAGTGYTGEDGVEIFVPTSHAAELFEAFLDLGVKPAGLGARDTLRLEAGFPLHGNELTSSISPLEAQLKWVVAFDKPSFRGKEALLAQLRAGIVRRIVGISTTGRRPPRAGCDVLKGTRRIGITTSGNYSPSLEHGIAFALVDSDSEIGDQVVVDVRGTHIEGYIVTTPFISRP